MENKPKMLEINLINNQFELEEAKNLLMQLIQDKINFHVSKNFSHQERFGKDDDLSKTRIDELKIEKENLKAQFEKASSDYSKIEINTTIFLSFK